MLTVEAWQAFGGVVGVLILLGGGALALRHLGLIRARAAPAPAKDEPSMSHGDRIAKLETRVAVLEERTHNHGRDIESIGKVHIRIDAVSETTSRIEGEISQMNRQLVLVSRHLMGERAP